jgi:mycothiol synthase
VTVSVRHPTWEDLAVATDVLNAHSRALHDVDDVSLAQLEEVWRAPEVEFPDDVFVAERDSEIVGYADVIPFGETSWFDGRAVDPSAYPPLIERATARAEEHAKRHIRSFASEKDETARSALEAAGYEVIRHGFRMRIDLDADLPPPVWPEGFTVRTYREGDAPLFHRGHQDSFADTWEFTGEPFEQWSHWFMGSILQPEHWFIVQRDDDVAAIAMCRQSDTEPDTGWVHILGVLPSYRRRGLALALLRHVFRHFGGLGMKCVGLGVDGENPTGAVALYERAGMHVARRNLTYERVPG